MFQLKNAKIGAIRGEGKFRIKTDTHISLWEHQSRPTLYGTNSTRAEPLPHPTSVPRCFTHKPSTHNSRNAFGPSDTTSTLLCNLSQARLKAIICLVTSLLLQAEILYFALSFSEHKSSEGQDCTPKRAAHRLYGVYFFPPPLLPLVHHVMGDVATAIFQ